jgi:hypothetical protein
VKRGRDLYAEICDLEHRAMHMLKRLRDLKGGELLALRHYADGLEPSAETDLVLGTATLVAAERYFAKAGKKQKRRATQVL